jgi:DNA-binding NarL/FixJ family response regulator
MIKLVIADDQLLFRTMLEEIIRKDGEFELAASCAGGEETIRRVLDDRPDVVLLDIQMTQGNGLDALRVIKKAMPDTKVVMLTTFENDEHIRLACSLGADGYLLKELKPDILLMAVKCIHNDMVIFHRGVFSALARGGFGLLRGGEQRFEFGDLVFDAVDLSIMRLIAVGKTNRDIAAALNYSEGTIKNRVSKILGATGLSDRTEISVFALKNQII